MSASSLRREKSHIESISFVGCPEPFLGGWFYTKAVVISICATHFICCQGGCPPFGGSVMGGSTVYM